MKIQRRHVDKKAKKGLKLMKKKESRSKKRLNKAISKVLKTNPALLIKYKNFLPSILGLKAKLLKKKLANKKLA